MWLQWKFNDLILKLKFIIIIIIIIIITILIIIFLLLLLLLLIITKPSTTRTQFTEQFLVSLILYYACLSSSCKSHSLCFTFLLYVSSWGCSGTVYLEHWTSLNAFCRKL